MSESLSDQAFDSSNLILKIDWTTRELVGIQMYYQTGSFESDLIQSEGVFASENLFIDLRNVRAISLALSESLSIKGMRFYDESLTLIRNA